ncbi:CSEP0260 putative effector protein [Blumeria hordei DH14]|uniref:CSEP0260 putative effector protein n=1 Tax=Blumeria graminis f. sp. hordei (strain DH14) TaxID=546991 RepID=N1J887_BLUG1|nr:CSEP0260 putative effector protein [Blumeria hordei DH14]
MKCTTFASITAILSLFTHAFAGRDYICDGKRLPYNTIDDNMTATLGLVYDSGNGAFQNPSRDKTSGVIFEYALGSDPSKPIFVPKFFIAREIKAYQVIYHG